MLFKGTDGKDEIFVSPVSRRLLTRSRELSSFLSRFKLIIGETDLATPAPGEPVDWLLRLISFAKIVGKVAYN